MHSKLLAILGLTAQFAGFIFGLIIPGLRYYAWGILALGSAMLAVAVVLDFKRVKGVLVSRRGRFGLSTIVKVSLFCSIVLITNAISSGVYHRFDFTGLAQFTLTSQTKEVLARLQKPVEVLTFFTPTVPVPVSSYAKNLLTEYRNHTDQLTVKNIDPDLNPDQARQYQVGQAGALYGVVVFRGRQGQRKVYGLQITAEAEHAFTSAILEVSGTKQKKVYFLTGHGEHSISSDYNIARGGLRDNLIQVDTLELREDSAVPEDAAALIMAGPRKNFTNDEQKILKDYLKNDGRLLILWNPNPPRWLRQFLAEWSLNIENGTIIDSASYVAPNQDTPLVPVDRNSFQLA
ncbi:MAG: GldG family protein, partial [Desulfocapsaceae bacterium]|nr:GldG family protein [Desulfocapsaceae bacterium]